jgi:pyrophosphatase PpaX
MKIKAIIFDLDGTILDSKKSVVDAVYYISEKYSPNRFTYEEIENRFGEPLDEFIHLISKIDKEVIFNDYMKYITAHHDELVKLFPNVKVNLNLLKNKGYKLAIATNKQKNLTYRVLELFDMTHLFDTVICLEDVQRGKPDPEMIDLACQKLGVIKEESIVIGDSIFDIKAAKAANVRSVILDWYGHFGNSLEVDLKHSDLFTNMDEILNKVLYIGYEEGLQIG